MKKYGLTMIVGLATLAIAGHASAAVTNIVRITGSTAYRAVVHGGIVNMIKPSTILYGWTGSTLNSAGAAEFRGALNSDTNVLVDIKVSWSGSVDGIQRMVNAGNPSFNRSDWLNSSSLTSTGTPNLATGSENAAADVAMSDAFQNSTIFQTPTIDNDVVVGVIPFKWVRNNGAPSTLSNVTSLVAQQILSAGSVPLKFFTNVPADSNTLVRVVGRNFDSGTRVVTYSESGFGVGSPPNQFEIFANGTVVTNIAPYHSETLLGVFFPTGQSGYSSGGTIVGLMNATGSNSGSIPGGNGWLVSYLGKNDANGVTNGTAAALTYNGVPYSDAAVENGQYTFWGYEHMFYNNTVTGDKLTAVNSLITSIGTFDPTPFGGIRLDAMTVGRTQEGAPVSDGRAY